jgi:hypothetical protein
LPALGPRRPYRGEGVLVRTYRVTRSRPCANEKGAMQSAHGFLASRSDPLHQSVRVSKLARGAPSLSSAHSRHQRVDGRGPSICAALSKPSPARERAGSRADATLSATAPSQPGTVPSSPADVASHRLPKCVRYVAFPGPPDWQRAAKTTDVRHYATLGVPRCCPCGRNRGGAREFRARWDVYDRLGVRPKIHFGLTLVLK